MPIAYAGGAMSSAASVVEYSDLDSLSGGMAMQLGDLLHTHSITPSQATSAYHYLKSESNLTGDNKASPDQLTEALEDAGVKVNKATEADDAADATKADDATDASKTLSTSESKGLQDGPDMDSWEESDHAVTSKTDSDSLFEDSDDESSDGLSSDSDTADTIADSLEEAATSDVPVTEAASVAGSAGSVVEGLADSL
jgi:hypothetical protein